MDKVALQCKDAKVIEDEYRNLIEFIKHGINLGLLKLSKKDKDYSNDPLVLQEMIQEIAEIIGNHKMLWLKRNRPGGLEESLAQLENLKKFYAGILHIQ